MFSLKYYSPDDYARWQRFVAGSANGTIFHNLDFLAYHGERFTAVEKHLLWLKGNAVFAVMPLAIVEENGRRIAKSPYGASYGGMVYESAMSYTRAKAMVEVLQQFLREEQIAECRITPPIDCVHRTPCHTPLFALLESGFKIVNSDISSVLNLAAAADLCKDVFGSRARNMARKAVREGVEVLFRQPLEAFWPLMEKTFAKHGSSPTHTRAEWQWLMEKLPGNVWCDIAVVHGKPVAGMGHFRINKRVDSSFYLCSDPEYAQTQALSLLIHEVLIKARNDGDHFFDFGTSSVNMVGRESIFRFKESYGATGQFRHTLAWRSK